MLFLIESLQRRANETPRCAARQLRTEVLWLADRAEEWCDSHKNLRYGLLMVRSLAIVHRSGEALIRLQSTMNDGQARHALYMKHPEARFCD